MSSVNTSCVQEEEDQAHGHPSWFPERRGAAMKTDGDVHRVIVSMEPRTECNGQEPVEMSQKTEGPLKDRFRETMTLKRTSPESFGAEFQK